MLDEISDFKSLDAQNDMSTALSSQTRITLDMAVQ
jgi:hypothetical protein